MISEHVKENLRQKYINSGCWGPLTFGQALEEWAERYKDRTALVDSFSRISYREWNELTDRFAAYFYKEGFRKGDRAVLQLPNSALFAVISFAFFKLGVIPVFALMAHREKEIGSFIRKTEAKGYLTVKKHLGYSYTSMAEDCIRGTKCRVYYEEDLRELSGDPGDTGTADYDGMSSYETACLLVSGGTTGIPKLIPRTHEDYLYDAGTFADVLKMDKDTVFLASIPLAHNFTFANPGLVGTSMNGGRTVMSRNGSADEILDLIEEEEVTITAMVPSLLGVCAEMAAWDEPERFQSLTTILAGGSPLTGEVLHAAEANLVCRVRQVFGTAEGVNTITPEDMDSSMVAGCQGKTISAYDEILIVDENDCTLPENAYGEMLIRGPYTIMNYFENSEADQTAFRKDGFYRTGDKACMDEKGYIHVGGRIREQINKSGEKIIPGELEEVIQTHRRVSASAVIGIPDQTAGERICACIVTRDKKPMELTELRDYLMTKQMTEFKLPDYVMDISSIPLTAVGKPDKIKLLQWFQESRNKTEDEG